MYSFYFFEKSFAKGRELDKKIGDIMRYIRIKIKRCLIKPTVRI